MPPIADAVTSDGCISPCELSSQQTVFVELQHRYQPLVVTQQALRGYVPARAAADANDGDRRAGDADECVDILYDNTDAGENTGRSRVACFSGGLAALQCASAARSTGGAVIRRGGGDSKDCKRRDCEELGEHG